MSIYTNSVTVRGYLGKDAETFATSKQKSFVVLSLATKSGYKDKRTKEWVNHTEWHRIVAFAKPADAARGLKKGDYVEVEGELYTSEYEKEIVQGKNKVKVTFREKGIRASLVTKLEKTILTDIIDADDFITEGDAA